MFTADLIVTDFVPRTYHFENVYDMKWTGYESLKLFLDSGSTIVVRLDPKKNVRPNENTAPLSSTFPKTFHCLSFSVQAPKPVTVFFKHGYHLAINRNDIVRLGIPRNDTEPFLKIVMKDRTKYRFYGRCEELVKMEKALDRFEDWPAIQPVVDTFGIIQHLEENDRIITLQIKESEKHLGIHVDQVDDLTVTFDVVLLKIVDRKTNVSQDLVIRPCDGMTPALSFGSFLLDAIKKRRDGDLSGPDMIEVKSAMFI
jgi:hypothetical protein